MPLLYDTDRTHDWAVHGRMGTDLEKSKAEFRAEHRRMLESTKETPLKEYREEINRLYTLYEIDYNGCNLK